MKNLALAATLALGALAAPAHAYQGSGMEFYTVCGNGSPAGAANGPFCNAYLGGFVDALVLDNAICPGHATDTQAMTIVRNWLKSHAQNLNRPAAGMIRDAFVAAWHCHRQH
jgi:hypothetical protein